MTEINQKSWDSFVAASPGGSFLQSWAWGEFQARMRVPFWRVAVEGEAGWQAAALALKRNLPAGQAWLYVPRGPLVKNLSGFDGSWVEIEEKVSRLARRQRALFWRAEPPQGASKAEILRERDWVKSDHNVQPRHTLVLDLTKIEEELLKEMHPKTRYNIGLAARRGVTIRFSTEVSDLEKFLTLSKAVAARSDFNFHPDDYYRAMREVLVPANMFEIALAEAGGQTLAAHLLISFGGTTTYAHGASGSAQRDLMAPHLLQWESIRRAKARGDRSYDFFGVGPKNASDNHPWSGITRFKTGFGGRRVSYIGAYDLVMQPAFYTLFNMARRARRIWR